MMTPTTLGLSLFNFIINQKTLHISPQCGKKKLPTIDFICEQMGHLHMANMILLLLICLFMPHKGQNPKKIHMDLIEFGLHNFKK